MNFFYLFLMQIPEEVTTIFIDTSQWLWHLHINVFYGVV